MELGHDKKKFIFITLVLVSLIFVSFALVAYQEDEGVEFYYTPTKITKEMKAALIQKELERIIPFESSIELWPEFSDSDEIENTFLHEDKDLDELDAKCVPVGFGYSKSEANSLFDPLAKYPDCMKETPKSLKFEDSKLVKVCENMEYSLGKPKAEELFGRTPFSFSWTKLESPSIDTESREYAFIKCGGKREAIIFLKRNNEAALRAQKLSKHNREVANVTTESKPLTVFLMIFDSLSRKHMYRNFPKTMEFLNETIAQGKYQSDFVMYDFLLNHAHGENTIPNMIPILFGHDFSYHKIRLGNHSHSNPQDKQFFLDIQKDSIWKQYEKMGFLSMFGFDIIWDFLVPAVGRHIQADHVFTNFWKASSRVFGTDNYINQHSCFGSYHSHRYMLDYVKEYLMEYKGINRFGYTHITTAHEKSGTIIKTVDDDLLYFMNTVLDFYKYANEDVFFVLAGDHGKHVSETDIVKPGWLENMLPAHLVIANKDLMQKLDADKAFKTNTKRLVSRTDWHMTLKHLSLVPYGKLTKDSKLYTHWKRITDTDHSISLLLDEVPVSRTCKDMNIEEYFCVCLPYEELTKTEINENEFLANILKFCLEVLNSSIGSFCRKLNLHFIEYAAIRKIEPDYSIYRVRVSVVENPDVVLEFFASAFSPSQKDLYLRSDSSLPTRKFYNIQEGDYFQIQVLKMVRIDEYAGYMEELSVALGLKPSFCILPLPNEISKEMLSNQNFTKGLDDIMNQMILRVAENGKNCFDECKEYDQICQAWAFKIIQNKDILFKTWTETPVLKLYNNTSEIEIPYADYSSLGEFADLGIDLKYLQNIESCTTLIPHPQICPCKK